MDEWESSTVVVDITQDEWGNKTVFTLPFPVVAQGYYFPPNYSREMIKDVLKYMIRTANVTDTSSFLFLFKQYDSEFNVVLTQMVNLGLPKQEAEAMVDETPMQEAVDVLVGYDSSMLFLAVQGRYPARPVDLVVDRINATATCRELTGHGYKSIAQKQPQPNPGRFYSHVYSPSTYSPYDFVCLGPDQAGYLRHVKTFTLPNITSSGAAGLFLNVSISSWWW